VKDLIEALQIFLKYKDAHYPTHCEHDELIVAVRPGDVSAQDRLRLEGLGFFADENEDCFKSYRFGSC